MSRNARSALALLTVICGLAGNTAHAADDILLGNIASTTHVTAAQNSANLVAGYTIYFEHLNRQGGVHGRKIKLVNKDDSLDAEKMVALTEELIADKRVLALVGYLNTVGLLELIKKDVVARNNIAVIAPIGAMKATNFYPVRSGYNQEVEKLLREALDTQKKRVALVYFTQTFGPGMAKFAQDTAAQLGVNIVETASFETAADKVEASVTAAAEKLSKANPDAVIIISAGTAIYNFVRKFRQTESRSAQLYALSAADALLFVRTAGLDNARGVVISQAIPYPQNNALAVVRDYQKMMKLYAPDRPLSFYGLEGFMGARIAAEALQRAGRNPTREKVIAALNTMKNFDLGDFLVSYGPTERSGSKVVELTIIGKNGSLYR